MKLINGQKISNKILTGLKGKTKKLKIKPLLAVILIGKNPASHLYIKIKEKRAKEINIGFKKYLLPEKTKQSKIIGLISELNNNPKITAILVQLPLPRHLDTDKIILTIDPKKDADGIHPKNLNQLKRGQTPLILPATTGAIIEALKSVNLKNKSVAIIGKSKIAGLPTYYYLKKRARQTSIYDSQTKNLPKKCRQADILIVAIGRPNFITANYVKKNAVIIDVGINKVNGKTVGDVDFDNVKKKAAWVTPVPGGIGPITVAMLLKNVVCIKTKQH
ncbi:bifunctional 5,10-methylene-tetrahydrofolate dehydrogenase/5,10-methylene-tetrahydrofolate cyclohydrolase [Candidatus Kuenenbacteria bacterium CG_4_8_14_3_um_filter_39_15]|uniref:Bifunctional protein FolD n=1 Tax=Candidatus Kuenenbacteria bacterium CG_4_8_14_3_um_filter_39_15 TaxID=1974615 RepID=A0A2M7IMK8_9BACT|nr:MAG: bifunctional 5,10-methylene-tetrahydrofolate dehydrogenase/5,10-methylene-tetrahydrofolate cyclohydrolase [Candidatus Kuenenbacteria bacterium CG_4_8_14_3_um_filter_39_15]